MPKQHKFKRMFDVTVVSADGNRYQAGTATLETVAEIIRNLPDDTVAIEIAWDGK